ncbi:uncharacterized protein LAJ45_00523 [Morchella importuna]|uniref:uncharacterized protein n=1 Tax=Morchella importuna TaxID=1174673 RepID=UPI001E8D3E2A|nr:uncharacterized protein LAJ45_00523 [Morchella importuna]KAH8155513.1 hypothetical protein LAJ45_00523 [Morchella importuna]
MKTFATTIGFFALAVSAVPSTYRRPGLVQSNQLRRDLMRSALLEHAKKLQEFAEVTPEITRVAGSRGHNLTVDYIYDTLVKTGYYDVELQPFTYVFSEGNVTISAAGTSYESQYFQYAPGGTVEAPLISVSNFGCDAADFPTTVSGNIALVSRGTCEFGLKVALAGAAGAKGIIIYNNVLGPVGGGTLGPDERPEGKYIPAGSLSQEDALSLISKLNNGTSITANLDVDALIETRYTNNVIATSKCGDQSNIVFSGGHTDSVQAGPGINDDGSGSMGILEIALQLTKFTVNNAVRFGFWSAEEFGLLGSEHYITTAPAEELAKISLYLNFDMIASPNFGYFIYDGDGSAFNTTGPAGSDHIEHLFEDYLASVGIKTAPTEFDGRSDYGPFLEVNIPSGGLFTGAEGLKTPEEAIWWGGEAGVAYDVNYHAPGDDITNLNMGAWIQNTKAAAHAIATYAVSTEGIPKRTGQQKRGVKSDKPKARCGEDIPIAVM